MKYGLEFAGPRVRRDWRGTVLTGLTLLTLAALAALAGWLLHVLRGAGCWMLDGGIQMLGSGNEHLVAMAPVPQGVALLIVLLAAALLIWWSVVAERRVNARRSEEWDREVLAARKAREARERVWREARAKARRVESWSVGPLESLSEAFEEEETLRGGDFERDRLAACFTDEVRVLRLGLQDVREIVAASRSESQAVLELIEAAQRTLSVDDYGDALAGAHGRLAQVVRTLGDLRRALEPQQEGVS